MKTLEEHAEFEKILQETRFFGVQITQKLTHYIVDSANKYKLSPPDVYSLALNNLNGIFLAHIIEVYNSLHDIDPTIKLETFFQMFIADFIICLGLSFEKNLNSECDKSCPCNTDHLISPKDIH